MQVIFSARSLPHGVYFCASCLISVKTARQAEEPYTMPLKREDTVFAEGFRFSQEGHAVWPKILSSEMKPGACGYFNGDGDWVTIVQLTDTEAVKEILGLPTPAAMTEIAPDAEAANRASLNTTDVESLNTAPDFTPLERLKVDNIGGSTDWSEKTSANISRQAVELDGAVM